MNLLIIGFGVVGQAVYEGLVENNIIDLLDIEPNDDIDYSSYDGIIICLPTPQGPRGECDDMLVEQYITTIRMEVPAVPILIKSTISPELIELLQDDRYLTTNPEFLTEKNAIDDFINPDKHIFGGNDGFIDNLEFYYKEYSLCRPCPVHRMSAVDASFVKYGINSFLAMKVLFFNQLYDVVENNEAAYNKIVNAITSDSRIGRSHSAVPGLDNKRGYGGACFPKDTSALFNLDKGFTLLGECVRINNEYRSQYELDQREIEQHVDYGQTEEKQ